jgi:hypothetical protein
MCVSVNLAAAKMAGMEILYGTREAYLWQKVKNQLYAPMPNNAKPLISSVSIVN